MKSRHTSPFPRMIVILTFGSGHHFHPLNVARLNIHFIACSGKRCSSSSGPEVILQVCCNSTYNLHHSQNSFKVIQGNLQALPHVSNKFRNFSLEFVMPASFYVFHPSSLSFHTSVLMHCKVSTTILSRTFSICPFNKLISEFASMSFNFTTNTE